MQQFKSEQAQSLSHRRFGFMKDIRNFQREQIKKRARSQVLMRNTNEELNCLINTTRNHVASQDLATLVRYANQHYYKAVAHIGNLILDGVLRVAQLEKFTLEPDYHPYWLWLVQVLVQNSYCTIGLFQHCLKSIGPNRMEKTVRHALSVLYKITASNLYSSFLMRDENVLLSIINCTLRQDGAAKVAYLLLKELIAREEGLGERFKDGILRERMMESIRNGLVSINEVIKMDTFYILTELAAKEVFFYEINMKIVNFVNSSDFEKYSDVCLDYLLKMALLGSKEDILDMIDQGLLVELGKWKTIFEEEDEAQAGRIIQVCREIRQRADGMGALTKGIHMELDRLNLLSFNVVIEM